MFSAYFLTCVMNQFGEQSCAVFYTEMPEQIQTQSQCNQGTAMMHQFSIDKTFRLAPELVVVRRENGCYPGSRTAGEVARDEHAKLLNRGIPTEFGEF